MQTLFSKDGLVVSMLTLYSDNPSPNPACFCSEIMVFETNENKQKEAVVGV